MKSTNSPFFVAIALMVAIPACSGDSSSESGDSVAAAESAQAASVDEYVIPAEATKIYETRCSICHGPTGVGDGAAAAALDPKPRNYQDKAWQAATSDQSIADAIVKGGPAVGLSATMPPNPDLASQPELVTGLVQIIRGFAK